MKNIKKMSDSELLTYVKTCNINYRSDSPEVSDIEYDTILLPELKRRNPKEPFLSEVEPEMTDGKTTVLPEPMLSTDKAYTLKEITAWTERIKKACDELKIKYPNIKLTPKLDGFAIYVTKTSAYSRGDGTRGTDLTRLLDRSVTVVGSNTGPAELLVDPDYFERELADKYSNTRNFQGSVTKAGELSSLVTTAIIEKAVVIYPFSSLRYLSLSIDELLSEFDSNISTAKKLTTYDIDGVVLEVTDTKLKEHIGSTRSFHRWQIAFKDPSEVRRTRVLKVMPQTSRTGRVNPVAVLEPITVSNAVIGRVTVHHYGMVKKLGIGVNAIVDITRAGLVIPKIVNVHKQVKPDIPTSCPSCNNKLIWKDDFLYCDNKSTCKSQRIRSIEYFFETLKIIDGFGYKTLEVLYDLGVSTVEDVYAMTKKDLLSFDIGDLTADNLLNELKRSMQYEIPDWTFLKAFGVHLMSGNNSEKLLSTYSLEDIFTVSYEEMLAIDGFGPVTAKAYVDGLIMIKDTFWTLYDSGFNIKRTEISNGGVSGILNSKTIVFTGTLFTGSRAELTEHAKKLGAKVSTSISAKTNILIAGDNSGPSKLKKAEKNGVKILTETEYLSYIAESFDAAIT